MEWLLKERIEFKCVQHNKKTYIEYNIAWCERIPENNFLVLYVIKSKYFNILTGKIYGCTTMVIKVNTNC